MNVLKYIRAAFRNRWNLLALFGGVGVSVLSGRPDIGLPLVAAVEVGYLSLIGTHPRFQQAVEAREAAAERSRSSNSANVVLQQILGQLPRPALDRYERLRASCSELRKIADDLQKTGAPGTEQPLGDFQLGGLDRLMWIFLRLMFTQHSLGRFLARTSKDRIEGDIRVAEERLESLSESDTSPHAQKIRRTLQDNVQTCRERLDNFQKAEANFEFVSLEIDRLENKIKSLAELGVNRQDPDYISGQVDTVARSLMETEKTMNDLQFATGLAPVDDQTPELVEPVLRQAVRAR